jgi:hypothetical protein
MVWAGAAALGAATPVCAQTGIPAPAAQLAPGEILLHIGAQGSAPADYATLDIVVSGQGTSKEEAESVRQEAEQSLRSALVDAGIDRSRIELGETSYSDYEDFDWEADAAEAAVDAVASEDAEVAVIEDPAYDAPRITRWNASSTMVVTVDDVARLDGVMQVASGESIDNSPRPTFQFRDEAKSKRAAIADALAEARSDADAYAEALGYRVVRIAGVTNNGSEPGLAGFFQTMIALEGQSQLWSTVGQKTVPITVDFVIAPK